MTGIIHYVTFLAILSLSNMHSRFLQVYLTHSDWKFLLLNMHVNIWCFSVWAFSLSPGGRVLSPWCFNLHFSNAIWHWTVFWYMLIFHSYIVILWWGACSDFFAHFKLGFCFLMFIRALCILKIISFIRYVYHRIFIPFSCLSFHYLRSIFSQWKYLILLESNFSLYLRLLIFLVFHLKNSSSHPRTPSVCTYKFDPHLKLW